MTPSPAADPTLPLDLHAGMRQWLGRIAEQALRYPQRTDAGPGMSVADRRAHYRDSCQLLDVDAVHGVSVQGLSIDLPGRSLAARLYRADQGVAGRAASDGLLAFFHGGGWVIGDLDTHDRLCRHIAAQLGVTVASIDYRLAPEHERTAICEDAADAVGWLQSRLATFGCRRLATGGDSAGGHLAAWAAHAHPTSVQAMLLIYPVAQRRFDTASYRQRGAGPGLTAEGMQWFWHQFAGDASADATDPRLDLCRLWNQLTPPPATVLAAWHDPLHDDSLALANHLASRGGLVDRLHAMDMPHGFARYWAVEPAARQHLDRALEAFAARWA
jgi:acetyl esterase